MFQVVQMTCSFLVLCVQCTMTLLMMTVNAIDCLSGHGMKCKDAGDQNSKQFHRL